MSLPSRTRCFTGWLNLRFSRFEQALQSVLLDLMSGTNMQLLLKSFTGVESEKFKDLDKMTQQQKQTRVEWFVKELKKRKLVPDDVQVDARLFALRSADHVFDLFWRLLEHDIATLWEQKAFLQTQSETEFLAVPVEWIPRDVSSQPRRKKSEVSVLSGFASIKSGISNPPKTEEQTDKDKPAMPSSPRCLLQLVAEHLQMTRDGKALQVKSLSDLCDARVLTSLFNSFIPDTFQSGMLLNDRWTIQLVLQSVDRLFGFSTGVHVEDLVRADTMAVCAFLTGFFMRFYQIRQQLLVHKIHFRLQRESSVMGKQVDAGDKSGSVNSLLDANHKVMSSLSERFDLAACQQLSQRVEQLQADVKEVVRRQIEHRFDVVRVDRHCTMNEFMTLMAINLSLTNGCAFYLLEAKEQLTPERKVVLRRKGGDQRFVEGTSPAGRARVRHLLCLPPDESCDIRPDGDSEWDMFVEATSRNKALSPRSQFLYAIFPNSEDLWERQLLRMCREGDLDGVQQVLGFFPQMVSCVEEGSGNTPLHLSARAGRTSICLKLLEHRAHLEARNRAMSTPLFMAIESGSRKTCQLLIEWGADVHCRNARKERPFDTVRAAELKTYLHDLHDRLSQSVPLIKAGDTDALRKLVEEHNNGIHPMISLQSRLIDGSTLLHTASFYGDEEILRVLTEQQKSVDLRDFAGATPLMRAKNVAVAQVLLKAGADVLARDNDGNTALHHIQSDIPVIKLLLSFEADPGVANKQGYLPVHCAAMSGNWEALELLLREGPPVRTPPSVPFMAAIHGHLDITERLLSQGEEFFPVEKEDLLCKSVGGEVAQGAHSLVTFLLKHGARADYRLDNGDSYLHLCCRSPSGVDLLPAFLSSTSSDANALNEDGESALFVACRTDNPVAAALLLQQGADIHICNRRGMTPFELVAQPDDWIKMGVFDDVIRARLQAYALKRARDLVRQIAARVA